MAKNNFNLVDISNGDQLGIGVVGSSVGNVNSRGYNWHNDWFRALNALDYYSYRYKYFYLENPPHNTENDKSGDTYDSVQERIYSNVEALQTWYGSREYLKNIATVITVQLTKLRNKSIAEERHLYNEVNPDDYLSPRDYLQYVYDTKPGHIVEGHNTIELWTKLVFPERYKETGGIELNPKRSKYEDGEVAFSLILSSIEFYNKFKSKEKAQRKKWFDEIVNNSIPSDRVQEIYKALADYTINHVKDKDIAELLKVLHKIFSGIVSKPYSRISYKKKIVGYQIDYIDDLYGQAKLSGQTDILPKTEQLKELLPKFQEYIRKLKSYYGGIWSANFPGDPTHRGITDMQFSFPLSGGFVLEDDQNILLSLQMEDKYRISLNSKGEVDVSTKHRIIDSVLKVIEDTMFYMEQNDSLSLNCLSLGKIEFPSLDAKQMAFYYARMYCQSNFRKLFDQSAQRNPNLWKSFLACDSNAWFSGLFGELSGLVNFNRLTSPLIPEIKPYNVKLTGATEAHIRGRGLGGSVNDLIFSKKDLVFNKHTQRHKYKVVRYGVNIKHYVHQASSTFNLYGSSGNNGVFTAASTKYLNAHQLNILRFILANSYFFEGDNSSKKLSMEDIVFNVALQSIPEYLRISDRTRSSAKNLFFQINNVIYPTSYIYTCALTQIERLVSRANNDQAFMNVEITGDNLDEGTTYRNLASARRYWKDKNYRLSTSKKPIGKNIKIKTRGIGVNLVQL